MRFNPLALPALAVLSLVGFVVSFDLPDVGDLLSEGVQPINAKLLKITERNTIGFRNMWLT